MPNEVPAPLPVQPSDDLPEDAFPAYTSDDAKRDAQLAGLGITTGVAELDGAGMLWRPGKFYVVMARQGEGKTTTLLHLLMLHVEQRVKSTVATDGPAVFVTYEENLHEVYGRLLRWQAAREVGPANAPPLAAIEAWKMGERTHPNYREVIDYAAATLDDCTRNGMLSLIDGDADGINVDVLFEGIARAEAAGGFAPSLLALDYFQKIRPPEHTRGEARYLQLSAVSDSIRRYVKTHNSVVLIGSQATRDGADEQPQLHHVREGDDIANDAAGVVSLWRPGLWKKGEGREPAFMVDLPDGSDIQWALLKNRDGRRGVMFRQRFYGGANYLESKPAAYSSASYEVGIGAI